MLLAAFRNHDKCVQALKGADVIVRNSIISTGQGCTPGSGHLTTLKTVRDVGGDMNTMNLDGIRRGDCDCGHDGDIIEVGANVNTMKQVYRTRLCDRLYYDNFVQVGVHVNTRNQSFILTLAGAGSHQNNRCIETIKHVGSDDNVRRWVPLIGGRDDQATLKQNDDDHYVGLPVPRETDVGHMKKNGYSIIVEAAGLNQSECQEILFQEGADVNLMDKQHTRYTCNECVEVILEAGARVNIQYDYGDTALMCAVCKGHGEYVETLIAAGADVNIQNKDGKTALLVAPYWCDSKIFDLLIRAGADVNITARDGDTVMRRISRSPWMIVEKLKLVYSARANVNMINVDGVNVVRERKKIIEILKLLYVAGENIDRAGYLAIRVQSELNQESGSCLSHLCRSAIREHLLRTGDVNLFYRVRRLGLPAALQKSILFDISLEDY